jgi:tRNA-dihydrouridine synthase B
MQNEKNFWQQSITLGNFSFPRIMAAPLDGVTDSPLRRLIRRFSPNTLLFGEMRHVACVANEKDERSLRHHAIEHPIAFQVSANRPDFVEAAIEKIVDRGFDMFNLNVGCPAPNVVKSGSGSALMADLPRLEKLLHQMRTALNGRLPFTIKIRAGFKERNAVDVARLAQDAGVEMLVIHPRTAPEGFTSRLDYEIVTHVKQTVSIPVVFSGNLTNFARIQKTYELTGVDGFMIGRALWGCPWKIAEINAEIEGRCMSISTAEALSYALEHLALCIEHYGPRGFQHFKKQVAQYLRGIPNGNEVRKEILRSSSDDIMRHLLTELRNNVALPPPLSPTFCVT